MIASAAARDQIRKNAKTLIKNMPKEKIIN
jgi:hypothetical protein